MQFDNATNLDRKSGVPGMMMIFFIAFPNGVIALTSATKAMVGLRPIYFVPRTLRRTWGTLCYSARTVTADLIASPVFYAFSSPLTRVERPCFDENW